MVRMRAPGAGERGQGGLRDFQSRLYNRDPVFVLHSGYGFEFKTAIRLEYENRDPIYPEKIFSGIVIAVF